MSKKKKNLAWTVGIVVAVIVVVGIWVVYDRTPGKLDAFAQCLEERGAIFYGAFWCPHCHTQKNMFGKSEKLLPYVECSTPTRQQTPFCDDQGIRSYPTWEFADGTREVGALTLPRLSEKTGCELPVER